MLKQIIVACYTGKYYFSSWLHLLAISKNDFYTIFLVKKVHCISC